MANVNKRKREGSSLISDDEGSFDRWKRTRLHEKDKSKSNRGASSRSNSPRSDLSELRLIDSDSLSDEELEKPRKRTSSDTSNPDLVDLTFGQQEGVDSKTPEGPMFGTYEDYMTEDEYNQLIQLSASIPARPSPNPLTPTSTIIRSYQHRGRTFKAGKTAELFDGTFIRIQKIIRLSDRAVHICGRKLVRNTALDECLPEELKEMNELCWLVELKSSESEDGIEEKAIDVSIQQTKRLRKVYFTNIPCAEFGSKNRGAEQKMSAICKFNEGVLFCRLKYVHVDSRTNRQKHSYQSVFSHLTPAQCDKDRTLDMGLLREVWRGPTILGGSYMSGNGVPDMERPRRQYTYGDGFCGGGGSSLGAKWAGVRNQWSFDKNEHAWRTCLRNFQNCYSEWASVEHFIAHLFDEVKVDIMHLSPPCQYFSPSHTVNGPNDDENNAALTCVRELVGRVKPRICTMEQTSGLLQSHPRWFWTVIRDLLSLGYSIRWRILNLLEFGCPQARKRLVVIASGPGEVLPPFPSPTHGPADLLGPDSTLKPFNSIKSMIGDIPTHFHGTYMHHELKYYFRNPETKPPYSEDNPVRACITTNGGGEKNYHPSGLRGFTLLEYALLQTFPADYKWGTKEVKRQIGNAVPPLFQKALYTEILKSLRQSDGVEE